MVLKYKYYKIENFFLLSTMVLYAFSYPFPQHPGLVEIAIALFFLFFILKYFKYIISGKKILNNFIFIFFFIFPLVVGVIYGNTLNNIIRDVIPYFYFSLFVVYFSKKHNTSDLNLLVETLPWALVFAGIIYSLRELIAWYQMGSLLRITQFSTEYYFAQSPVVLFSTTFLLINSLYFFNKMDMFKGGILLLLFFIPISVFFFMVLRAPLILTFMMAFIYLMILFKKNKIILLIVFGIVSFAIVLNWENITDILQLFIKKQEIYGDNSKLDELYAIIKLILFNNDFTIQLFGKGWGALWYSPAVGAEVRYAHSLLTFMILKMGLLGLISFFFFNVLLMKIIVNLYINFSKKNDYQNMSILLSIIPVLIVNIFLESAYKTLDFGIILLLLFALFLSQTRKPYLCKL